MRPMRCLVFLSVVSLCACEVPANDISDSHPDQAAAASGQQNAPLDSLIQAGGFGGLAWQLAIGKYGYADTDLWVAGDDVYAQVGNRVGLEAKTEIHSIQSKTGAYRWTLTMPGPIDQPPSVSAHRVAFVCGSRAVVVDRTTGGRTSEGLFYSLPSWPSAQPALTDTTLYVPTYIDNKLETVDLRGGRTGWSYRTRSLVAAAPVIAGEGGRAALILVTEDGLIVSLPVRDAGDVAPRQENWAARTYGANELDPIVHGDMVFVASMDSSIYAFNYLTGTVAWRHLTGSNLRGDLAASGDLVFARDDSEFLCLDAATGAEKWTAGGLERFIVRRGDNLVIRASDGTFSVRRASDGQEVAHFDAGMIANVAVNATGELFIFGDGQGTIYALK
jgi:outer membrane protein assembly factor BamB